MHQELFGTYEGYLMKKPSFKIPERTRGTFLQFLTRENLLTLSPLFLLAHTVQGYGYLDEVINLAFITSLDVVPPGVGNLRLDLEQSQVCG